MKLVFVSNFFNHHQKPLAEAFSSCSDIDYTFIETSPISEERLKMGWGMDEKPSYVISIYESDEAIKKCQELIDSADVTIFGDAPYKFLVNRLKQKKLTFLYRERLYKKGIPYYKLSKHFIRNCLLYGRYKNLYLLCASAYISADFARLGCFINKAYKWGYFTEFKKYDADNLIQNKTKNSILWVARFLDWKHPEITIEIAKRLKYEGYEFNMNLIGNGVLMEDIKQMIKENNLEDCVHLLGTMKPNEVRSYMENSEVFLFTSDRNEGWGAVANESMNSGCAVVASHAIGSVPFLIESGENGLIYKDGDIDDVYSKVKFLLDNPGKRKEIAMKAYKTIEKEWNADVAKEKFLSVADKLLCSEKVFPYKSGVCSRAEYLQDNWIKKQN